MYLLQIPALLEKADESETGSDYEDSSSEDSDSGCKEFRHPKDLPAEVTMDKKVSWPGTAHFPTSAQMTGKKSKRSSEWFFLLLV